MANKSESIKGVMCHCATCFRKVAINLTNKPTDARVCERCGDKMQIKEPIDIELTQVEKRNIGKLSVEIDVSDALKGLKAVERQAKKTACALREVESLINNKN